MGFDELCDFLQPFRHIWKAYNNMVTNVGNALQIAIRFDETHLESINNNMVTTNKSAQRLAMNFSADVKLRNLIFLNKIWKLNTPTF